MKEQIEVLRRSAERGLRLAHDLDTRFVDIFQHLLDEIERLKVTCREEINTRTRVDGEDRQ